MKPFAYVRATSVAEAARLLGAGSAAMAGGTDLLGLMKGGIAAPARVVDLTGIDGLRGWSRERGAGLRIGALTPLVDLETSDQLARHLPIVRAALADTATLQLRNAGTVGGNLLQRNRCWYFRDEAIPCWLKGGTRCFASEGENEHHAVIGTARGCNRVAPSDLAPALIAHDARVTLVGARGTRSIALADLYTDPALHSRDEHTIKRGEILTEVHVPEAGLQRRGTYLKAMERKTWSFAVVSVAAAARVRDGKLRNPRIVLGGVAPVPWRVEAAEAEIDGHPFSDELARRAADALLADAAPLAKNGYKVPLAKELVRRALAAIAAA
ncbi:MAG: FAD binding domain-containing protein [Chloroflexota bacterium]|nr:FAD binding domain-containing protein [Chloroflexota bacterium]MDE3192419.1 FAD binding domain-containing protein [Chloroflexota bacterium]